MVGPEFASCWLKIGRAEEHLGALKGEIKAWLQADPYSVVKLHDLNTGRHSLAVRIRGTAPFDRLALVAGDCAHNLRCALDHLVFALAIAESGQNPPPDAKKIQFPIVDSAAAFEKQRYRIGCLTKKSQDFIESVQPYNRHDPELPPILGVLNIFENADKHQLIHLTYDTNVGGVISFLRPRTWIAPDITWLHEPLEDGKEFVYFTTSPNVAELDYKFEVSFSIGVRHIPGPTGRATSPLESVMVGMMAEVSRNRTGLCSRGASLAPAIRRSPSLISTPSGKLSKRKLASKAAPASTITGTPGRRTSAGTRPTLTRP